MEKDPDRTSRRQALVMRIVATLAASLALPLFAAAATIEDISPHFPTNTAIIWQAPTNGLPKRFWIYKKLPRVFSAAAISNGIVLASLQSKGFPHPSTNHFVIWADHTEIEPQPPYFSVFPEEGEMTYTLGDRGSHTPQDIVQDEAAVQRAWKCVSMLGVPAGDLVRTNAASPGAGNVCLPRQIDGIPFFDATEGFQFELDRKGRILNFSLQWPTLQRQESVATASPQAIISCIRAHQAAVIPAHDEQGFFRRVKELGRAKKLTITRITPYYGEGIYGEDPPDNERSKCVTPTAILEAVATFGTNSASLQLSVPILSSDVQRLLSRKGK
jgi:hypothetical protein